MSQNSLIVTSAENAELFQALAAAKRIIQPVVKKGENPHFKSAFATLADTLDAVEGPLLDQGILLIQPNCTDGVSNFVTTRLIHLKTGQFIESSVKLELAKTNMQEIGSATTYAKRQTITSLLGLRTIDDDAEASMNRSSSNGKTNVTRGSFKKEADRSSVAEKQINAVSSDDWDN